MSGSSVIGALRVNLGLDSAQFAAGLGRAAGNASGFESKMAGVAARVGKIMAGMAVAAGSAAAAMGASAINAGNEISRLSQVAGTGPEQFQRWAAGAKSVGIEQEKLSDILKDVNDRVGDFVATGGGPMADFFENIAPKVGVTADMFRDLSGADALQLYIDSLERAGANQQDMTFYLEAMASDVTLLLPLLRNGGAEMQKLGDRAERLGAIMDSKAVASMVRAKAALSEASTAMAGVGNAIGVAVAPMIEAGAQRLTRFAESLAASMKEGGGLKAILDTLIGAINATNGVISSLVDNFEVFGVGLAALAATRIPALLGGLAAVNWSTGLMTAQFVAGAVASRALTVAQAAMAVASRGLAAALALVGGPIGLLVGVATALGFALYGARSRADEVRRSINDVTAAQGELNEKVSEFYRVQSVENLEAAMAQARTDIEKTREALASAQAELENAGGVSSFLSWDLDRGDKIAAARANVELLQAKLLENESTLSLLEHAWSRVAGSVGLVTDQTAALTAEQIKAAAAGNDMLRAYERQGELRRIETQYGRESAEYLAAQNAQEREILATRLQTMDITEALRAQILAALDANQSAEAATHRWAAAMGKVGAQIRGIAAALASIGGGMIDNASKFVELNALRAGQTSAQARRTAEYDRQDKELSARSASYKSSYGEFVGGIIGQAEQGVVARGRLLDAELEAEHAAAAAREKIAGGGGGGGAEKGKAATDAYASAVKGLNDELAKLQATAGMTGLQSAIWGKQAEAGVSATSAAGQQIAATMEQIEGMKRLKDATERGEQAFKSLFGSMLDGADAAKKAIVSLISEMAKVQFTKGMMGLLGGTSWGKSLIGSVGGLLGGDYDGGGYTGNGPRTGGLDGKGGFLAMMHPRETVIDHTRGQTAGGGSIQMTASQMTLTDDGRIMATVRAEMSKGFASADRALPARVQQIQSDPRRRG